MPTLILHSLGEYERISDHAVNIMHAAKEMESKGLSFSNCAEGELGSIGTCGYRHSKRHYRCIC